jgi:hypothetical protein
MTKRKSNPPRRRKRTLTPEEQEDARDVALIKRTLARGGKTYSHAQVMRELGRDDLATPLHKRG